MQTGLLLASAVWIGRAWAGPTPIVAEEGAKDHYAVDEVAATHCATSTDLVGASCSYSTGLMARRVVEEGRAWTGGGPLIATEDKLDSSVAAPFVVWRDDGYRVIANELVQVLWDAGRLDGPLVLTGKWLEVDGVRYVVLTSYKVVKS